MGQQGREVSGPRVVGAADVSKELGKGGLGVQPGGEQQRPSTPVRAADVRESTAHLQEKGNGLEGVLCARLRSTEGARRKEEHFEARRTRRAVTEQCRVAPLLPPCSLLRSALQRIVAQWPLNEALAAKKPSTTSRTALVLSGSGEPPLGLASLTLSGARRVGFLLPSVPICVDLWPAGYLFCCLSEGSHPPASRGLEESPEGRQRAGLMGSLSHQGL